MTSRGRWGEAFAGLTTLATVGLLAGCAANLSSSAPAATGAAPTGRSVELERLTATDTLGGGNSTVYRFAWPTDGPAGLLLETRYTGSGGVDALSVPPYVHFLQVYAAGRYFGKEIKIWTPDSSLWLSSIGPAQSADIGGQPLLMLRATPGTAWVLRFAR